MTAVEATKPKVAFQNPPGEHSTKKVKYESLKNRKSCLMYGHTLNPNLSIWKEQLAAEAGKKWKVALSEGTECDVKKRHVIENGVLGMPEEVLEVDVFTPEESKAIIANAESIGYLSIEEQRERTALGEHLIKNNSGMLFVESAEFAASMWRRIKHLTRPEKLACRDLSHGFEFCGCPEGPWEPFGIHPRMKLLKYTPGDSFSPHSDTSYKLDVVGPVRGQFRNGKTLAMYLNTANGVDYSGGELSFLEPSVVEFVEGKPVARFPPRSPAVRVTPSAGRAAIFNPKEFHTAEVITSGTKYMIQADIMYRAPSKVQ
eukprot:TRINITY_DN6176_c0_g1_i1.p1 TRINITY_DN6176_c0_g1~~TRINITY_DN6176_c0_g1_i1.p1  ORF type:complete len:315 (+),score=59.84 TRINITY_DN6176_c0_g1_i1:86-1030(+)